MFYGPVCVRARPFWRRKYYGRDWYLSWWSHSAQKCSRNIECRKIRGKYSWSKFWSRLSTWQYKVSRGLCFQDFLNQNHIAGILTGCVTNWTFMGWTLHRQNPPETLQELCDALMYEWNNIPQAFIQRFIGSMRRRCEVVVAVRGGQKSYWTPQASILHDNFYLSMICSDNDVEKFWGYCRICYAQMNKN